MDSSITVGFILVAVSGILIAFQSGVNLTLGANIGKTLAATWSFATGTIVLAILFALDVRGFHLSSLPTLEGVRSSPWWSWLGGPLGAFYIASIIIFAPKLGAGNSFAVFVSAQLVTAMMLDVFGLAGYQRRRFHWARGLGLAFLVVGVVLITQFGSSAAQPTAPGPPPATAPAPSTAPGAPSDSHQVVDMTVAVQKQGPDPSSSGRRHVLQIKNSQS